MTKLIKVFFQHEYLTTDLNMKKVDYVSEDVQNLSFKDSSFDIILSNHVLEHVRNDGLALNEMARILKKEDMQLLLFLVTGEEKTQENFQI